MTPRKEINIFFVEMGKLKQYHVKIGNWMLIVRCLYPNKQGFKLRFLNRDLGTLYCTSMFKTWTNNFEESQTGNRKTETKPKKLADNPPSLWLHVLFSMPMNTVMNGCCYHIYKPLASPCMQAAHCETFSWKTMKIFPHCCNKPCQVLESIYFLLNPRGMYCII